MNILFLMYPWDRVDPNNDSTLRMIHECVARKHTVALATVHNLTMRESTAMAFCNVFIETDKVPGVINTFYKKARFRQVKLPLGGFDAIIMRSNPPLNVTALNFLDSVRHDVFIMNDIDGLRIANNKLYTSSFDDPENRFIPKTYVSKTPDYLEKVLRHSPNEKMIMKPLDGYGGHGVILVEKQAIASFRSLLDFYINSSKDGNYVILQEYVEGAELGDVRILMLNGKAIGAMKRIPAAGDMRSNVHAGGTVVKHTLTQVEKDLCALIGPKLVRDGLFFVGIDVINGKLIEVNVLSPGGIMRINKLNRVKLQTKVIDFVEQMVKTKTFNEARRTEFVKALLDD
ncbi:glutathione synthetase [Thiosulfativibrio zosterae]|uniref:Glutathione synthetase n=1 Tax=Thiosulfativibrio zosterae TaxID=2675053 RepID=A0A6F8PPC7_9GAMM|nr:glutathione synthetase [Thiosulfativibrio zosterae]BBP43969.1 glutathione synthetase [Thiosulfativibrio zosterae]